MSKRKAPSSTSSSENLNEDFCDMLFELANYEKNVNRNQHKHNAYRKAASTLSKHPKRITSGDEAKKLNGIGDKIAKKIDEMLETGKLRKIDNIRADDTSTAINLLTRVNGIGPAKARDLVEKDGVKTIKDLEQHLHKLTKSQQIGVKHFEDFEKRIPRHEIQEIELILKKELKNIDQKYTFIICGSYRRGLKNSGDIDVLLTHEDYDSEVKKAKKSTSLLTKVIEGLEEYGLITDTLSHGESKFMGVCRLKKGEPFRRLDILLLPKDQYYCGVLYFTGSDIFNKKMRTHALEKGFTLNEYSLRPMDKGSVPLEPLPVSCEEDIFDYISYSYKTPEQRCE